MGSTPTPGMEGMNMSELEHCVNCECRYARECETKRTWAKARANEFTINLLVLAVSVLAGALIFVAL